jgi:hypothetical protein
MKRFWYVLIELYETGAVKAAVIKNKLSDKRPPEFYRQEPGREIFGEWFDDEAEARAAVAEAKAANSLLTWRAA